VLKRYKHGSVEQIALFAHAARLAGVPVAWGSSEGLANILRRESAGVVGRPNYTYGKRARDENAWPEVWAELRLGRKTAKSSATGLGQLLLSNVDKYYPGTTTTERRAGIGSAVSEAIGMLKYIKARYQNPENAWSLYGKLFEGY